MSQPNYADNCVAVSPLCGVSDTDKCLSVAAQTALATFYEQQRGVELRATEFYYSCARVGGRRATIGKWNEMKLNLGECRYFPFPHCCICKPWGTFRMGGGGTWLRLVEWLHPKQQQHQHQHQHQRQRHSGCSQLLPTSVSAVVRSRLSLHRSWQCCFLKAQRWPELNEKKRGKKNVP